TDVEDLVDLPLEVFAVVRMHLGTSDTLADRLRSSGQALHRVVPSDESPLAVLNEEDAGDGVDGGIGEFFLLLQRIDHRLQTIAQALQFRGKAAGGGDRRGLAIPDRNGIPLDLD